MINYKVEMRDTMSKQFISFINKGYDEFNNKQLDQAIQSWQEGYQQLITELKEEKISILQLGNLFGFKPSLSQWLKDIANLYMDLQRYDEAIDFCQKIINLFKEDKYLDDFQSNIGKALFLKGELDQGLTHYDVLLKKYPNDLQIIYDYLSCLKKYDIQKAKDIILRYVPLTLEYNNESEPVFKLSKEILENLDEKDIARQYQNVNKKQNDLGKRKPVTKKVTVGRNDSCPCGSGKKYKKCCGR